MVLGIEVEGSPCKIQSPFTHPPLPLWCPDGRPYLCMPRELFPLPHAQLETGQYKKVCAWRLPSKTAPHNLDTYTAEKGAKEDRTSCVVSPHMTAPMLLRNCCPVKQLRPHAEKERSSKKNMLHLEGRESRAWNSKMGWLRMAMIFVFSKSDVSSCAT